MRKTVIITCLLSALFLVLQSCSHSKKKGINWTISLDHEVKDPYGTSIARQSLPDYFPAARIENISRSFRYTSIDNSMLYHGDSAALLVMIGLEYYISDEEWVKLKAFANSGNEIFILCSTLDGKLAKSFNCHLNGGEESEPLTKYNTGKENITALSLLPDTNKHYGYKGRSITGYFTDYKLAAEDSLASQNSTSSDDNSNTEVTISKRPDTIGRATNGPDFMRYKVGAGHITLHAAPLVLSNYFLLQDGNRAYLDSIWHSFPSNISSIYWNEYYKRSTEGSDLGVLFRYPSTRWALIIAISVLIIYVIFGLKRRQRIVPVIKPMENASVSFVETVGRLYFNKGNHANLAEKMIQHFLEWVRTYYYIDTSMLNEDFIKHLISKSGQPEDKIRRLMQSIHDIRTGSIAVNQEYLYSLHRTIQSFYNNNYN